MFKIELENRDFRWHHIKSKANIKWTLEKIWAAGTCQRPDIYHGNLS